MRHADTTALSGGLFSLDLATILPLFQTMMVGALPIALFCWVFFYVIVRGLVGGFQTARKARLERRRARQERAAPRNAVRG